MKLVFVGAPAVTAGSQPPLQLLTHPNMLNALRNSKIHQAGKQLIVLQGCHPQKAKQAF